MEAPLSAAYMMAFATIWEVPPVLLSNIWQDMMRTPSPFPLPPATPQMPSALLFTAATIPAQCVPCPESCSDAHDIGPFFTKLNP